MHDELQDKIVYGEHQIKYLENEIINEQRYRQRAGYDKQQSKRKVVIYMVLTCFLGFALLFISLLEHIFSDIPFMYFISLPVLLPIKIIMIISIVISVYKLIKYTRRVSGNVDRKTFAHATYREMNETSGAREKYLQQELLRTQLTYQANQEMLEVRTKRIAQQDMKTISGEELEQIREEYAGLPEETVDVKNMGRLLDE